MLETGQFSDITIVVGAERQAIKVHRNILASHSGYFKGLFYGSGGFAETESGKLNLPDQVFNLFRRVMEYIYTGEYYLAEKEGELDDHARMFCLGAYFDVEGLRQQAMDRIAYWTHFVFKGRKPEEACEQIIEALDPTGRTLGKRIEDQWCFSRLQCACSVS